MSYGYDPTEYTDVAYLDTGVGNGDLLFLSVCTAWWLDYRDYDSKFPTKVFLF